MKNILKKITAVLTALLISALFISADKAEDAQEKYSAHILIEARTGAVLDEYNADLRMNAGYMTKLMSLILIAEDIEKGKYTTGTVMTASQAVAGTDGAVVWIEPDENITVDELLKAVIVGNANDAMTVLAEYSEQSVEDFVMRMNSEAFDLGLRNTAFYSPYGYYDEREYTTAHDLAIICAKLSEYDALEPYFCLWRDFVRDGKAELVSENTLSRTYDRHIGFKASHSEKSGYCIAEGGRNDEGNVYISVVLGAENDDISMSKAKELINRGFSGFHVMATMFPDEMLMPVKVKNGVELAVEICLKNQSNLVVPKSVSELNTVVVLPEYLTAPLKKGQVIGSAGFYSGDTLVCETDIIVKNNVKALSFGYSFKKILSNIIKKQG
ncbi:MAG: serine hydrolase [Ruminococcus flavefaciens]|nr:serine hydrolase [Ruminococcus flavefaciens]